MIIAHAEGGARRPIRRLLALLVLGLAIGGCSHFTEQDEDPTEQWSAEKLYFAARDRLDSGYYKGAIEYYQKLEQRFPFGPYAQQGQLELAYAYYKSEDEAAAVAALDRFIKLFPTHRRLDYAYYLRGVVHFNQGKGLTLRYLPTDLSQRDLGPSLQAFRDFTELIRRFPDSRYVPDARKRMVYLRNLVAQHELNVAHYYMRRGAYIAAANRARYVVEHYQGTPAVPDALAVMAQAYKVLELDDLARDALEVLEHNYPNHPGLFRVRQIVVR